MSIGYGWYLIGDRLSILHFYRDAFRTLVLGKSSDEVARLNGWEFRTDGVHLSSHGGLIVANLVESFVLRGKDQSL